MAEILLFLMFFHNQYSICIAKLCRNSSVCVCSLRLLTSFCASLVTQGVHIFCSACTATISQRPHHSYTHLLVQSVIPIRHLFFGNKSPTHESRQMIHYIIFAIIKNHFPRQGAISISVRPCRLLEKKPAHPGSQPF